jgi:hypothetical protein
MRSSLVLTEKTINEDSGLLRSLLGIRQLNYGLKAFLSIRKLHFFG